MVNIIYLIVSLLKGRRGAIFVSLLRLFPRLFSRLYAPEPPEPLG